MAKRWTKEDKDFLRENYGSMTTAELSKVLGRSRRAIVSYAKSILKLEESPINYRVSRALTDTEIQFILENYYTLTAREISNALELSYAKTVSEIYKLRQEGKLGTKQYTEDDINFLKLNYKDLSIFEMAEILGRSYDSVIHKLYSLGLTKKGGIS